MVNWIDFTVVSVIVVVGLVILYRALKEPLDLVFGLIKKGIIGIRDNFPSAVPSSGYEVITYG